MARKLREIYDELKGDQTVIQNIVEESTSTIEAKYKEEANLKPLYQQLKSINDEIASLEEEKKRWENSANASSGSDSDNDDGVWDSAYAVQQSIERIENEIRKKQEEAKSKRDEIETVKKKIRMYEEQLKDFLDRVRFYYSEMERLQSEVSEAREEVMDAEGITGTIARMAFGNPFNQARNTARKDIDRANALDGACGELKTGLDRAGSAIEEAIDRGEKEIDANERSL